MMMVMLGQLPVALIGQDFLAALFQHALVALVEQTVVALIGQAVVALIGQAVVTLIGQAVVVLIGQALVTLIGQAVVVLIGQAVVVLIGQAVVVLTGQAVVVLIGRAVVALIGQAVVVLIGQAVVALIGQAVVALIGQAVRLAAPVLTEEITQLINYLIMNQSWPTEWKSGNLTPVFKKDEDTRKENYRPVSILTAISKVYEKVMFDQLYSALHEHLSPNLSGFLKKHSCCTALLKMTEDWRQSLDNREAVIAVAVDLSKAFDSINHNLLLAKLRAYGFSPSALNLISSYLLGRRQRVKLSGVCSSYSEVMVGVPQGSLLGPLLFNIYINDFNYAIPDVSLRLYADDTTMYASDVSPLILEFVVNNGLEQLLSWFQENHLMINTKT